MRKKKRTLQPISGSSAWKIAYADFVTAMMVFFLLMWLINTTSQEEKNNLSSYFEPMANTVAMNNQTTWNMVRNVFPNPASSMGAEIFSPSPREIRLALKNLENRHTSHRTYERETNEKQWKDITRDIQENLQNEPDIVMYQDQVFIHQNAKQLFIEIVDSTKKPMFPKGSALLYKHAANILKVIIHSIKKDPHNITIIGHTDAHNYSKRSGYTNWELSADRANVVRRIMVQDGLGTRIRAVIGCADTRLLFPQKPYCAQNRRISIILKSRVS